MPKGVKKPAPTGLTKAAMKAALKEALAEILEEKREWLQEAVLEALEDRALVAAIQEGKKSKLIPRREVMRILPAKP